MRNDVLSLMAGNTTSLVVQGFCHVTSAAHDLLEQVIVALHFTHLVWLLG